MVIERPDRGVTGTARSRAYCQGVEYLQAMRGWALAPTMVAELENYPDPIALLTGVGQHQAHLNAQLQVHLQACHDCCHPAARPQVQIFAVPLASAFGWDGVCNSATHPTTILVDLGRVLPQDWLRLVVHEYAHAQVGAPGHHTAFVTALSHLCLGLGLEVPPPTATDWPHWPRCRPTADPLAFWRGLAGSLPQAL